jgi:hypothetical protein
MVGVRPFLALRAAVRKRSAAKSIVMSGWFGPLFSVIPIRKWNLLKRSLITLNFRKTDSLKVLPDSVKIAR